MWFSPQLWSGGAALYPLMAAGDSSGLYPIQSVCAFWIWRTSRGTKELKYLRVLTTSNRRMGWEMDRWFGAGSVVEQAVYRKVGARKELMCKAQLSIYHPFYIATLTYGRD